ncbi:MAG: hexitol phosphatase HxpB [Bacteroidota bacterium]|jgi:sugar-phosphatase
MRYRAAIFDMDGLLIDSEPHWQAAGRETLDHYGKTLTEAQYHSSTGLRTEEWIEHWFRYFGIGMDAAPAAVEMILEKARQKIGQQGVPFPGIESVMELLRGRGLRIGLATSSPASLVNVVLPRLNLSKGFDRVTTAGGLPFGKPHPQVYLDCAEQLGVSATECIAFEDSYYGMIAAKAARMTCVVVPSADAYDQQRWAAADLKLRSLTEFREEVLNRLG